MNKATLRAVARAFACLGILAGTATLSTPLLWITTGLMFLWVTRRGA